MPVKLDKAGQFSVKLLYNTADNQVVKFNLGDIGVHKNVKAHEHKEEEESGIKFLMEQQWIVDFALLTWVMDLAKAQVSHSSFQTLTRCCLTFHLTSDLLK